MKKRKEERGKILGGDSAPILTIDHQDPITYLLTNISTG
jgi:hypothetical protein